MRRPCFALLALTGLYFSALLVTPSARADDWSKSYKLTGRPNLRVTTNDAHVDLYTFDGGQIDAHVSTTSLRIGNGGVKITENQDGNSVTLDVQVPSFHFSFGFTNRPAVLIELHIPRNADFDVETGDGSITSQAFDGNLRLSSGDGSITAHGLKGQIRLHSGDGNINADNLDGTLHADSGDGRVQIQGRFDQLSLESGDGSIIAEAAPGSKVAEGWSLRSGDGSITLRLPNSINADLDADTGDGRINLDFPVTISGSFSRTAIHGKIGSGGPPLIVHTGDGSIHLEKM